MKVLSLFDGISAGQEAFKNLGIEFDGINNQYFASEIDKYAIQITQKNFPNTKQLGNVKGIIPEDYYIFYNQDNNPMENGGSFKADIDLLIGGFPCQDLSIAKKNRQGLQGERSSLFYEYLRILNKVKPKFFIMENVASMKKEDKAIIDKELGIEGCMINSANFTAQQRKRIYWAGRRLENGKYEKVDIPYVADKGIVLKDIILDNCKGLSGKDCKAYSPYNQSVNKDCKVYSLGTNPHCQTAVAGQLIFQPICAASRGRNIVDGVRKDVKGAKTQQRLEFNFTGKTNTLTTVLKDNLIFQPIRVGQIGKGGQGDRVYSVKGKSVCLSANGGGRGACTGLYKVPNDIVKFNTKQQKKYDEMQVDYEKSNCLTEAIGRGGSSTEYISSCKKKTLAYNDLHKIDLPDGDYLVRKLDPIECERLQGFSDDYTNGISNTQRYKALGNSFTVPVIEHILTQLIQEQINEYINN